MTSYEIMVPVALALVVAAMVALARYETWRLDRSLADARDRTAPGPRQGEYRPPHGPAAPRRSAEADRRTAQRGDRSSR